MASLVFQIPLLCFALLLVSIGALSKEDASLKLRNGPGMTDADTIYTFKRVLHSARAKSDDGVHSMNKTSLDKSWAGATLFQYSDNSIEVICSTCYVKGAVTGTLTIAENFNLNETISGLKDSVTNVTSRVVDQLEDYAEDVMTDLSKQNFKIRAFPTLDFDLNLEDLPSIPESRVHFEFEDLELYLDLEIILTAGATYTLNLFTSETPAGFAVPGLTAGAVFSVDLILIAAAEIDIQGGIHIKLDEGLVFDLELFNSNLSSMTLPSGSYEFLPVTIEGQGSIQAILSLQTSVGFEFASNDLSVLPSYSAGVSADIFAYVADFMMGVQGSSETKDGDCELAALAEYTLAVGAAAGATVAVDAYSWGPSPNTTIPVWYTTLASVCAETKSTAHASQITDSAHLQRRDDLIITSVTTEESYTIVRCISSGFANCPVNLQNTTSYESTLTSIVTVESGVDPTFPVKTHASVTSAIPFGTNVKRLSSTAGAPSSYTPSATSSEESTLDNAAHGTNKKLIIGLCVGLGLPFLVSLIVGLWFCVRRRNKVSRQQSIEHDSPGSSSPGSPPVQVHEVPRKPVPQA